METCRLTTYTDLEWALQQVRGGRSVLVVVPRPETSRRETARHLEKMQAYMAEARHEAIISGVRHAQVRRYRLRRYVSQFTLSPLATSASSDDDHRASEAFLEEISLTEPRVLDHSS